MIMDPFATPPVPTNRIRQRPTALLLHGFLGSGADWDSLRSRCASRYRCITPDLPGHGPLAKQRRTAEITFTHAVDDVVRAMGAGCAAMVGYSMGGRLALAATVRAPDRVRCLVIVSAWPGLESGAERQARARQDDRLADRLEVAGTARFLESWYEQPLFASLGDRPGLRRALIRRRSGGAATATARALRGLSVGRQPSLWPELPRLPCPVLFVAGERDAKYRDALARAAGLCRRGRLLIVPGAGHMPHLEHPDFFNAQVESFLREHAR